MPQQDVGKLAFEVLENLRNWYLAGYALFLGSLMGWFFHAKSMRKSIAKEMKRLAAERNKLQEKSLGTKLKSSDRK
jgi:hypothetical protein